MVEEKVIVSEKELPDFAEVLSVDGGSVAVHLTFKRTYAVLSVGGGSCIILAAPGARENVNTHDLKARCKFANLTVSEILDCDPDVIENVNNQSEKKVKNANESEAESTFDYLMRLGINKGASDIHLVRTERHTDVFMRINGDKHHQLRWDNEKADQVIQSGYNSLADQDSKSHTTWQMGAAQDAVIERILDGETYRVRYAHAPIYPKGYHVAMRILPVGKNFNERKMTDLGYSQRQAEDIDKMIGAPTGVIIIAGSTGSGKSTTIVTLLMSMIKQSDNRINVITMEDPPEYEIPNAIQMPVSKFRSKESDVVKKNPFAEAIRSAMRRDPDILSVGEVRDGETAEGLAQAVQSGHKSITTIHANSAIDIISRLSQLMQASATLGDPKEVLGSPGFLTGLMYQTLLPTMCTHCRIPYDEAVKMGMVDDALQGRLESIMVSHDDPQVFFTNRDGCEHCDGGITGRTVTAEVVIPDLKMVSLFREGKQAAALEYWLSLGGEEIAQHGISKVLSGVVSPHDFERKLNRIPVKG